MTEFCKQHKLGMNATFFVIKLKESTSTRENSPELDGSQSPMNGHIYKLVKSLKIYSHCISVLTSA